MAEKNRNTLKTYFQTGKKPTEAQFADLIDSFVNRLEDDYIASLPNSSTYHRGIVQQATTTEARAGTNNTKYTTPLGVNNAVEALAPSILNVDSGTENGSMNPGICKYFTANASQDYIHLKLPYSIDVDNKMFYIKASGYAYSQAEIIDIVWVGYCNKSTSSLRKPNTDVSRSTTITAGQYIGSNNHIYLWFKPFNTYYMTFKLDSIRVGNGTLLKDNEIEVIKSPNIQL